MKSLHNEGNGKLELVNGCTVKGIKEGMELVVFEERVNDDKGDWIYLVK